MSFEKIIGNEKVKTFLNKQIEENRILHSYLFVGIDGIGKTLFAKEYARKILCIDKEENESCISCIKWKSANHPDFYKIEPENKTIKIEQIRQMQERISEKPITSKKKVYLIIDSDTMTKEAREIEQMINDAGLVVLPNSTHYAYLERLGQTNAIIKTFIK